MPYAELCERGHCHAIRAQLSKFLRLGLGPSNHPAEIGDQLLGGAVDVQGSVGQDEAEKPAKAPVPAVPIKKSIGTDFLVCLEDGKKVKTLKRYLASRYN